MADRRGFRGLRWAREMLMHAPSDRRRSSSSKPSSGGRRGVARDDEGAVCCAMDHSATIARQLARLVYLLMREPSSVDEQKATLRALVMVVKEGGVELQAENGALSAGGVPVPAAFSGVSELAAQLAAHGLRGLAVNVGAGAAELLATARLLAAIPEPGDAGAAIVRQHGAVGGGAVHLHVRPAPGQLPELELVDEPLSGVASPRRPRLSTADVAPRGDAGTGGMFGQFAPGQRPPSGTPAAMLAELADATTPILRVDHLVEDLVPMAEQAVRDVKPQLVCDILHGMVRRESAATDQEERRILAMGLRRAFKAHVLRTIATQLPRTPERREELMAVLTRAGDDGADALVEQIASVSQASDRRVYFDALLHLQDGVPHQVHMHGDSRWFVARNAADLLGEMQAPEAEQPLTWLLQHEDDRVRRSATTALMRLGTPRATQAIQDALKDSSPQLRKEAAGVLAGRKDPRTVATLLRALDAETDEEVQTAFLVALGRIASPEAVRRLAATAEPEKV